MDNYFSPPSPTEPRRALSLSASTWALYVGLALLVLLLPWSRVSASPAEHVIHVEAGRFAYTPSVLRVERGDRVTLELSATDVVHGLSIDGYDLALESDPGQTTRLSFIADKPGMFRFRCTVTCGNLHPFMIGKFYVGSNLLFWRLAGLAGLTLGFVLWKATARR